MSDAVRALKKVLKKDEVWKIFNSVADMASKPEFDNFLEEIMRLHKTRELRLIKGGHVKSSKLSSAALNDQATRSRAVEIVMLVTSNRNNLDRANKAMAEHIEAHYTRLLFSKGCKTKMEQRSVVNSCMSRARGMMDKMDTLIEISDLLIDDVDKGSFAIKHAIDALQVAVKRSFAGG